MILCRIGDICHDLLQILKDEIKVFLLVLFQLEWAFFHLWWYSTCKYSGEVPRDIPYFSQTEKNKGLHWRKHVYFLSLR